MMQQSNEGVLNQSQPQNRVDNGREDILKKLGIIRVPDGQQLLFKGLKGALLDFDETIAVGAGKVHDGPTGAFATATEGVLHYFDQQVSGFTPNEWARYSDALGHAAGENAEQILEIIRDTYNVNLTDIATEIFMQKLEEFYRGDSWRSSIQLPQPMSKLLKQLKLEDLPVALVTASGEEYISQALGVLGLGEYFAHIEVDAQKKTPKGFNGCPVEKALEKIDVNPKQAVFGGDSPADIGSSAAAGVGAMLLRAGADGMDALLASLRRYETDLVDVMSGSPTKVFLLEHFGQVSIDSGGSSLTYELDPLDS